MARTKVTPRKSVGGKAPRFQLEMLVARQLLEIVHDTAQLPMDATTVDDLNGVYESRPAFFPSVGAYFEAFARRTHPDTVARLLRANAVQGDDTHCPTLHACLARRVAEADGGAGYTRADCAVRPASP